MQPDWKEKKVESETQANTADTITTSTGEHSTLFWPESTRPVRVDPEVAELEAPPTMSRETRELLKRLALDRNPDKFRDPYVP